MQECRFIDICTLSNNMECLLEPLLGSDSSFLRSLDWLMVSMVIFVNQYIDNHLVSWDICVFYAYSFNRISSTYFDFGANRNVTNVVDCVILWDYFPYFIALSVVTLSLLSMLKMGKLTQSQKALFLWKNPTVKTQWFLWYTWSVIIRIVIWCWLFYFLAL
jgi:hypothetical protein